ncbi:hypothetical protein ACM26X_17490 [Kluyvera cryocrescens]|uniref:hypothetical protein n=1 Tax=Kluyvera cryocrescens TaxID=580 RepID=UPI0039F5DA01
MKVLMVSPDFEGEYKSFSSFFEQCGFQVYNCIYDEMQFKKPGVLRGVAFHFFMLLNLPTIAKKIRWDINAYENLILKSLGSEKYDTIFIVKPFLLSYCFLSSSIFDKVKKCILFNYDTMVRFPIDYKLVDKHSRYFYTFDIDDAIKYGINYAPLPRSPRLLSASELADSRNEQVVNSICKKPRIIFYGAFSIFRFTRLLILSYLSRKYKIKSLIYLRLFFLKRNFKFFSIYIGGGRRAAPFSNIRVDIPQKKQSGGSARTSGLNTIMFSYSYNTPRWRFLDIGTLCKTYRSFSFLFGLLDSGNHLTLLVEEQNNAWLAFKVALDKTIQ